MTERQAVCGNCRWWKPGSYPAECRRCAPLVMPDLGEKLYGDPTHPFWPITQEWDWCAEHQPEEASE